MSTDRQARQGSAGASGKVGEVDITVDPGSWCVLEAGLGGREVG